MAWVRTWDASAAAHRARSSLVGCKDKVLIGIATRLQYGGWRRNIGATSLRSCSITATWCSGFQWSLVLVLVPAGRPWAPAAYIYSGSSWSSRELSRPARGGVLQSQKRTLLLLLLAGHVAVSPQGHAGRLWTAEPFVSAFARPRPGDRTKPRTRD